MKLYSILGVHEGADLDTIKQAYRKLAQRHHPDKGGDRATFEAVQHAYEVLSDPERRAKYDATGDDAAEPDKAARVNAALAEMLLSLLDQVENPESFDILGKMRLHIGGMLNKVADQRQKLDANIAKRDRAKARLKLREGTVNIAAQIIDAANAKDRENAAKMEDHSQLLMEVLDVLNQYDYEWGSANTGTTQFFQVFNGQIFMGN